MVSIPSKSGPYIMEEVPRPGRQCRSGWAVPFVCVPRWHPSGAFINIWKSGFHLGLGCRGKKACFCLYQLELSLSLVPILFQYIARLRYTLTRPGLGRGFRPRLGRGTRPGRSEGRGQRSEVRGQRSEAEVRGVRGQKRSQRSEGSGHTSRPQCRSADVPAAAQRRSADVPAAASIGRRPGRSATIPPRATYV